MRRTDEVIDVLIRAGHGPVAPHIAGRIALLHDLTDAGLGWVGERLTTAQLRGMVPLPDPLPSPPTAQARWREATGALDAPARRLLLAAALATTARLDIVLAAATADPAVLFAEGLRDLLVCRDGGYRFASPGIRDAVLADASAEDVAAVHTALAEAHDACGEPGRAAWHATSNSSTTGEQVRRELVRFGETLLEAGSAFGAYQTGALVASSSEGALRARGLRLTGQAALALGSFEAAVAAFEQVLVGPFIEREHAVAEAGRLCAIGFLDGPAPGETVVQEINGLVPLLRHAAATTTDHAAVTAIERIVRSWFVDHDDVDAIQAGIMLSSIPSRDPWPWSTEPGPLSPLIDGYVRGQQTGLLLHTRDRTQAAAVLRDAIGRLPMTHLAGGVTLSALAALRETDRALWDGYASVMAAIRPRRIVDLGVETVLKGYRLVAISRDDRPEPPVEGSHLAALTSRQREVARRVAAGLTNKEIGAELGISERTVEVHLTHIFRVVGAGSRAALVALILGEGHPPFPDAGQEA